MNTEGAILNALAATSDTIIADSHEWATVQGLDAQTVVGAIKSLSADDYVALTDLQTSSLEFTAEGKQVLAEGSPEFRVWSVLAERGSLSMPDLQAAVGKDAAKIGMGNAMKSRWIRKEGGNLFPAAENVTDEVLNQLQAIQQDHFAVDGVDAKVGVVLNKPMCLRMPSPTIPSFLFGV
jgi:phenylalanyl-tRNA synthetase alpha chain